MSKLLAREYRHTTPFPTDQRERLDPDLEAKFIISELHTYTYTPSSILFDPHLSAPTIVTPKQCLRSCVDQFTNTALVFCRVSSQCVTGVHSRLLVGLHEVSVAHVSECSKLYM